MAQEKLKLQTTERSMLRHFAGPRRGTEEDYIDWVGHATREAKKQLAENEAGQETLERWQTPSGLSW